MFMWVCQVGDIMSTSPTLVPSLCPNLKGRLLGLGRVLLLTVLPTSMLLTPTVLLSMLAVLSMLALLLLLL